MLVLFHTGFLKISESPINASKALIIASELLHFYQNAGRDKLSPFYS